LQQEIWAENWGAVPLWRRGAGSPSNTMWPEPRPTHRPSFIFIHPPVWPQYTNVTDRTEQDNGPIAQDEPFYKRLPKNETRCPATVITLALHKMHSSVGQNVVRYSFSASTLPYMLKVIVVNVPTHWVPDVQFHSFHIQKAFSKTKQELIRR